MFPTEIVDIIIGHLHDDWATLHECTTVCRTWTVSARYHLFRNIKVPLHPDSGDEYLRKVVVNAFGSPLGKQCGPYVRMLTITHSDILRQWTREPEITLVTLGELLSLLPRLGDLRLILISWPAPPIHVTTLASASVTSLIVCRAESSHNPPKDYKSIQDGSAVLRLLPALKSLTMLRSSWEQSSAGDYEQVDPPTFPDGLKLEKLDLRAEGPACVFINYTIHSLDFSALTSLTLWSFYTEDIPAIGKLIRAAAHSLEFLELRLAHVVFLDYPNERECTFYMYVLQTITVLSATPEEICPGLSLGECTKLKTVWLFVPCDQPDGETPIDYVPYWDVVNAILAILPLTVQDIKFTVDDTAHIEDLEDSLDMAEWDVQARAYERLPELQSVMFCGGEYRTSTTFRLSPPITSFIADSLPVLDSRGILKVDW